MQIMCYRHLFFLLVVAILGFSGETDGIQMKIPFQDDRTTRQRSCQRSSKTTHHHILTCKRSADLKEKGDKPEISEPSLKCTLRILHFKQQIQKCKAWPMSQNILLDGKHMDLHVLRQGFPNKGSWVHEKLSNMIQSDDYQIKACNLIK